MNMNMNIMMAMTYTSNSITIGVGSFTTCSTQLHTLSNPNLNLFNRRRRSLNIISNNPTGTTLTRLKIISAVNSGLEASIADSNEGSAALKNAQIVVESGDENKIQLRVDLNGDQTQRVFDMTLRDLARTAPPVPGFRMQKGGKSSKIPKDFLIQMLGEERVTKFVIQEILNSTMADYAKKENLDVKDRKISTTQTADQLKRSFRPGKEFGFNVIIEPESSQNSSEQDSSEEGSS